VAKLEGKLFDFYTFALSYDGFAVATPSLRGSAYGTWDVARVARRWSERSAELAPARAGVASRRPKGWLNWVPFGQVKEQSWELRA